MTELAKTLSALQHRLAAERTRAILAVADVQPDERVSDEALRRIAHLHAASLAVSSELESHETRVGYTSPD